MGLLSRLFGRSETRAAGTVYLPAYLDALGVSGYNDTGVSISEDNALIASAVFGCCSTIAQTISPLPCKVHDRETKEHQRDHPLSNLLSLSPNPFMTAVVFLECMLFQSSLWGASYAVIVRDERGYPIALYPLESSKVRAIRKNGELLFEARIGTDLFTFTADQILYLLGWSLNGVTPVSPVRMSRQAIGLAVAMERYAAKAFSGGNIGGILQTPPMNDDAMKAFVESWRKKYAGIDNAFKVAILPDPMKFVPTTMDPEKGQMTAARKDQILQVAMYWRVPPHMLGLLEKSSYASIEAQNLSFYQQCIQHWITKLEQELQLKCLLVAEESRLEVKFLLDNLLRPATTERYAAYMTGRQAGFLSVNDIRRKENLPPVPGGDELLRPLNMIPLNAPQSQSQQAQQPPSDNATRALIEDAARRLLTKEGKALARAAKKFAGKPDELRTWATEFYGTHAALVTRVMAAPIQTAVTNTTPDNYAKQHCQESVRAIIAAIESRQTIEDLTDEWAEIRPCEIADVLLRGKNNAN